MEKKLPVEYYYDDEIDLKELIMILIKEKKTIAVTFLLVSLLSLGGALYNRDKSKEAVAILKMNFPSIENGKTPEGVRFTKESLTPVEVIQEVYKENNIREKNGLSLDEFRNRFEISGIIPSNIENQMKIAEKSGKTLNYTPKNYKIELRVGSAQESEKILKDYYKTLSEDYSYKYLSKYRFEKINDKVIESKDYDYEETLNIINRKVDLLQKFLTNKADEKIDFASFGYGYREVETALTNLEKIRINELQNYLEARGIVKNKEDFKNSFQSRKSDLLQEIESKQNDALGYKNLIDSFQMENRNRVIPKGIKISTGENSKEKYYTSLIDNYLNTELQIENLKNQLKKLELKNSNLKEGTVEEKKSIQTNLDLIIKDYNTIVDRVNALEEVDSKIENGAMIQLATPITLESNSKAKLILAIGVVMGAFLGIMMAFIKNFLKDFKKGMGVVCIFFLMGTFSYSKENNQVIINFTHKEINENLNPDKTPFIAEDVIVKEYLENRLNIPADLSKNISVEAIYDKDSYKKTQDRLKTDDEYMYIPTEYLVTVNMKDKDLQSKILNGLKEEFPKYYIENILKLRHIEFDNMEYGSYRLNLESMNNFIEGVRAEIKNREKVEKSQDLLNEYKNIELSLDKFENIDYRNFVNFIETNRFVKNADFERVLLKGRNEKLKRRVESLNNQQNIYKKVLKEYKNTEEEAVVLENGDLSISGDSSLREKQYIQISKDYINTLQKLTRVKGEIERNDLALKEMKVPTEGEKEKIDKGFESLKNELNSIRNRMRSLETRGYRKEYLGSVKTR